ncbi:MAG: transcriptional repressor [Chloroflexi bacterium]|nr:transcriptional repressor [Chloroflexota bacterium]
MNQRNRFSRRREIILDVLRSVTCHPTAEWVHAQARKQAPRLSLGTTYRNLRLLAERGIIQELELGQDLSRYDGNPRNHVHFCCDGCGRVLDIADPTPPAMDGAVARDTGLKITSHRLFFHGLCQECQHGEVASI